MESKIEAFKLKMRQADLDENVIDTFIKYYNQLREGNTGKLSNDMIESPNRLNLINYDALTKQDNDLLNQLAVIKLNGGLGTSMGLDKAKSLLPVKGEMTFLDILANQIISLREKYQSQIPLIFMNSYKTRQDTLELLENYKNLKLDDLDLDFLQNKYPRIRQDNMQALELEDDDQNWNPPGHGDIYSALYSSGLLDSLLDKNYNYAFISNSDNLGAVIDPKILTYMEREEIPFIMEVCRRTEMDKKGGHLAQTKEGNLILREVAQCPENEISEFQDIKKYSYFNTNNLWVNLKVLKKTLLENNNTIELPLIINPKKVNDIDVYQIETAMGAAISVFKDAKAIVVPRSRFAPVKKTNDLLLIWSDVYKINSDYQIVLTEGLEKAPTIELDNNFYKTVEQLKNHFREVPSLIQCNSLKIEGNVLFGKEVYIVGDVTIKSQEKERISDAILNNEDVTF
jgi:UTP--glucose-1-phosphate uridylyltransferase